MSKHLFIYDIKKQYENGKRLFEDADIDYAQMTGFDLSEIIFRNCRFNFSSFTHAKLQNAKFIDCKFFFGSFRHADLKDAIFDNVKMEFLQFDNANFDNTIFRKCNISYTGIMNTNIGAAIFENCIKFKVFENVTEITYDDLQGAAKTLMPSINDLDIEIKNHILSVLSRVAKELNVDNPISRQFPGEKSEYGTSLAGIGYGKISSVLDDAINIYNKKNLYKTRSEYEKSSGSYGK